MQTDDHPGRMTRRLQALEERVQHELGTLERLTDGPGIHARVLNLEERVRPLEDCAEMEVENLVAILAADEGHALIEWLQALNVGVERCGCRGRGCVEGKTSHGKGQHQPCPSCFRGRVVAAQEVLRRCLGVPLDRLEEWRGESVVDRLEALRGGVGALERYVLGDPSEMMDDEQVRAAALMMQTGHVRPIAWRLTDLETRQVEHVTLLRNTAEGLEAQVREYLDLGHRELVVRVTQLETVVGAAACLHAGEGGPAALVERVDAAAAHRAQLEGNLRAAENALATLQDHVRALEHGDPPGQTLTDWTGLTQQLRDRLNGVSGQLGNRVTHLEEEVRRLTTHRTVSRDRRVRIDAMVGQVREDMAELRRRLAMLEAASHAAIPTPSRILGRIARRDGPEEEGELRALEIDQVADATDPEALGGALVTIWQALSGLLARIEMESRNLSGAHAELYAEVHGELVLEPLQQLRKRVDELGLTPGGILERLGVLEEARNRLPDDLAERFDALERGVLEARAPERLLALESWRHVVDRPHRLHNPDSGGPTAADFLTLRQQVDTLQTHVVEMKGNLPRDCAAIPEDAPEASVYGLFAAVLELRRARHRLGEMISDATETRAALADRLGRLESWSQEIAGQVFQLAQRLGRVENATGTDPRPHVLEDGPGGRTGVMIHAGAAPAPGVPFGVLTHRDALEAEGATVTEAPLATAHQLLRLEDRVRALTDLVGDAADGAAVETIMERLRFLGERLGALEHEHRRTDHPEDPISHRWVLEARGAAPAGIVAAGVSDVERRLRHLEENQPGPVHEGVRMADVLDAHERRLDGHSEQAGGLEDRLRKVEDRLERAGRGLHDSGEDLNLEAAVQTLMGRIRLEESRAAQVTHRDAQSLEALARRAAALEAILGYPAELLEDPEGFATVLARGNALEERVARQERAFGDRILDTETGLREAVRELTRLGDLVGDPEAVGSASPSANAPTLERLATVEKRLLTVADHVDELRRSEEVRVAVENLAKVGQRLEALEGQHQAALNELEQAVGTLRSVRERVAELGYLHPKVEALEADLERTREDRTCLEASVAAMRQRLERLERLEVEGLSNAWPAGRPTSQDGNGRGRRGEETGDYQGVLEATETDHALASLNCRVIEVETSFVGIREDVRRATRRLDVFAVVVAGAGAFALLAAVAVALWGM